MKVKKISAANVEACWLPKLFDEEKIDFQPIQCVNWAEYPYKPKVNFPHSSHAGFYFVAF